MIRTIRRVLQRRGDPIDRQANKEKAIAWAMIRKMTGLEVFPHQAPYPWCFRCDLMDKCLIYPAFNGSYPTGLYFKDSDCEAGPTILSTNRQHEA